MFDALKKYLGACRIFVPVMVIQVAAIFYSTALCFWLIPTYGFFGVAWVMNITYLINCTLLVGYIKYTGCVKESWIPWEIRALKIFREEQIIAVLAEIIYQW